MSNENELKTDEKTCPYCGETIKKVAIKCKHCQSELIENFSQENHEIDMDSELSSVKNGNYSYVEKIKKIREITGCDYDSARSILGGEEVHENLQNAATNKIKWVLISLLLGALIFVFYKNKVSGGTSSQTMQNFVNESLGFKQISLIEQKFGLKPITVSDARGNNGGKIFTYEIEGCKASLDTDKNGNTVGYTFPINAKCPFKAKLGVVEMEIDSKTDTLKSLLDKNPCYDAIVSNGCIGAGCGNINYSDDNHLDFVGPHVCGYGYLSFDFNYSDGVSKWQDFISDENRKKNIWATNLDANYNLDEKYWIRNSNKIKSAALKYWGNDSPVSVTNVER